jgi:hypothetical protein
MQAIQSKLETTKAKLEAQDFTGLTKDDVIGDLLHTTAFSYFVELDSMNRFNAKKMGIVNINLPSEIAVIYKLDKYSVLGVPLRIYHSGLAVDVGRNLSARKAIDGDNEKTGQFVLNAGQLSSTLEHSVLEQIFSTPGEPLEGVSAVKVLMIANDQGIPIYTVNQTNIDSVLPQLQIDADVIFDIQNAVNAGKEVTVSKTNISHSGWTGTGYIIIDPITGDGAYMISGGLNGGWLYWVGLVALIIAIIAIGLICLLSGICAIIAAAIASLILQLAIWWELYFAGSIIWWLGGIALGCAAVTSPPGSPPDENIVLCMLILIILRTLTALSP